MLFDGLALPLERRNELARASGLSNAPTRTLVLHQQRSGTIRGSEQPVLQEGLDTRSSTTENCALALARGESTCAGPNKVERNGVAG